jgi:hypothetical protein
MKRPRNSPISLVLHLAAAIEDTYVSVLRLVSFAPLSSLNKTFLGFAIKREPGFDGAAHTGRTQMLWRSRSAARSGRLP